MFLYLICVCLCQIYWGSSKQELLFSDFCEDSDNIEEGAEYNKVQTAFNSTQRHEYSTILLTNALL